MAKDAPGMRGNRSRNKTGPLRRKRGDTHIKTIEEMYDLDLKVRGDMHLKTYLENEGLDSLDDLIESGKGRK